MSIYSQGNEGCEWYPGHGVRLISFEIVDFKQLVTCYLLLGIDLVVSRDPSHGRNFHNQKLFEVTSHWFDEHSQRDG